MFEREKKRKTENIEGNKQNCDQKSKLRKIEKSWQRALKKHFPCEKKIPNSKMFQNKLIFI